MSAHFDFSNSRVVVRSCLVYLVFGTGLIMSGCAGKKSYRDCEPQIYLLHGALISLPDSGRNGLITYNEDSVIVDAVHSLHDPIESLNVDSVWFFKVPAHLILKDPAHKYLAVNVNRDYWKLDIPADEHRPCGTGTTIGLTSPRENAPCNQFYVINNCGELEILEPAPDNVRLAFVKTIGSSDRDTTRVPSCLSGDTIRSRAFRTIDPNVKWERRQ